MITHHSADHASLLDRVWNHCLTLNSNVTLHKNTDNHCIVAFESNAQYFQCNKHSYQFLQHLDGTRTVQDIVLSLAIKQELFAELEVLLNKLWELGLIQQQQSLKKGPPWWYKLRYPVAMKFTLFNPSQLLSALHIIGDVMFSRFFVFVFFLLMLTSLILLPQQWSALEEHWNSRFFETQNWLMFFLAYLMLKTLHEIGHGLAVTKQGGKVTECGILLLVFMPLPFTNTSSSYLFAKRSQRVLVGLAGMWFELTIAMLAFIYWGTLTPGYFKDFVFNLSFIGSFSTLIFNLNPLMKFDGYYILCDAVGVLNLNERAVRAFKNVLKKELFKLPIHRSLLSKAEHKYIYLFYLYAILAVPYRVVIGLTIALYLSDSFFVFGLVLAFWVIFLTLCVPAFINIKSLYQQSIKENKQYRFMTIVSGCCCLLVLLLSVNIFSFSSSYPTLTMTPAYQELKAKTAGTITQLHVNNHDLVSQGDAILNLANPQLVADLKVSKAELQEYIAQYRNTQFRDKAIALSWQEKIKLQRKKVTELSNNINDLKLTAANEGEVILNNFDDLAGTYVQRGDTIGHIVNNATLTVSAIISQAKLESIRDHLNTINIMFYSHPGKVFTASVVTIKPAAYSQLPSRFLGSSGGGDIVVDARDPNGKTALTPFFIVELEVRDHQLPYLPARGIVRIYTNKSSLFSYFWKKFSYYFSYIIDW